MTVNSPFFGLGFLTHIISVSGTSKTERYVGTNIKLKSYHMLGTTEWNPKALEAPKLFRTRFAADSGKPNCLVVVFERDADYTAAWGSDRFAVAFMNIDSFAVYRNL